MSFVKKNKTFIKKIIFFEKEINENEKKQLFLQFIIIYNVYNI